MSNPVPQTKHDAAVVIYESPGSKYSVITAVEDVHGGRIQVEVIRLREAMDSCLLGSILGESTS